MNMRLVIVVKSWFRVLEKNSCVQSPAQEEMGEQDHGYLCNIFLSFLMIDGWIGGGWCRGGLYFMHTTNLDKFFFFFLGLFFPGSMQLICWKGSGTNGWCLWEILWDAITGSRQCACWRKQWPTRAGSTRWMENPFPNTRDSCLSDSKTTTALWSTTALPFLFPKPDLLLDPPQLLLVLSEWTPSGLLPTPIGVMLISWCSMRVIGGPSTRSSTSKCLPPPKP